MLARVNARESRASSRILLALLSPRACLCAELAMDVVRIFFCCERVFDSLQARLGVKLVCTAGKRRRTGERARECLSWTQPSPCLSFFLIDRTIRQFPSLLFFNRRLWMSAILGKLALLDWLGSCQIFMDSFSKSHSLRILD